MEFAEQKIANRDSLTLAPVLLGESAGSLPCSNST